jgi:hypothetical protein
MNRAREIRNTIVHVKPATEDVDIMETLLEGRFFRDADEFIKWLNLASKTLKMERHPDVNKILDSFRHGFSGGG